MGELQKDLSHIWRERQESVIEDHAGDERAIVSTEADEVKPDILSSTFHFPKIMLNIITSSVSDSLAICPEYKVVSCRIRKAKKAHLRQTGEVVLKH